MLKRLLILALFNPYLVSVAYAADDEAINQDFKEQLMIQNSSTSTQQSGEIVKNSTTGLHGRYVLTPSRCAVCHSFNRRADGKKLNIKEPGDIVCDWCHSFGSASSYYVVLENEDGSELEQSTGHSRGFGISAGDWRAPDDTYPAFTPRYWLGGLTCFDCHSVHANPSKTLGHNETGEPLFNILDSGFTDVKTSARPGQPSVFEPGRWILKKNPDREISEETGVEIKDTYDGDYSGAVKWPVNKLTTNWDNPSIKNTFELKEFSSYSKTLNAVSELCIDCHDGNAGLHSVEALLYAPENGASGKQGLDSYVEAYSHDSKAGRCSGQMVQTPEDGHNDGPECRSCHRADGDCDLCHFSRMPDIDWPRDAYAVAGDKSSDSSLNHTKARVLKRGQSGLRAVSWDPEWRNLDLTCSDQCANFGFSYPHKTFAWKMLKNELYGTYFDDRNEELVQARQLLVKYSALTAQPAHDVINSVCLDCHNMTVWAPDKKDVFIKGVP